MTSASPREIHPIWCEEYDVTWHVEDEEGIRAGRALVVLGEGPRWPTVAGWALAATAVVALVLIAGAPAEERGMLAAILLPVLIASAFTLLEAYAMLPDRPYAFKQMPSVTDLLDTFGNTPDVEHPVTVTISDEGYATASRSGPGRHGWTHFRRVRETDEFFLLLLKGGGSYYLPKRAVPADDLEPIRGILRRHLGEQARLMNAPACNPQLHGATQPA